MNFYYKCSECGEKYEITPDLMVCPICSKKQNSNEPLRGILEVILDGKIENRLFNI